MLGSSENQFSMLLTAVYAGVLIGVSYDICRLARTVFRSTFSRIMADVHFCLSAALIVFVSAFIAADGELRLFLWLGYLIGLAIYLLGWSVYVRRFLFWLLKKWQGSHLAEFLLRIWRKAGK